MQEGSCKLHDNTLDFIPMKRSRTVRKKAKSLTETGQILPWELLFAEYMATQVKRPPVDVQVATATAMAQEIGVITQDELISYDAIKLLKQRKAYKEYLSTMSTGGLKSARRMLQVRYPRFVDHFVWAGEQLRLTGNAAALGKLMLPMIDRVDPLRGEKAAEAILVNITVHQAEGLAPDDAIVETDYEVIDEEPKALSAS